MENSISSPLSFEEDRKTKKSLQQQLSKVPASSRSINAQDRKKDDGDNSSSTNNNSNSNNTTPRKRIPNNAKKPKRKKKGIIKGSNSDKDTKNDKRGSKKDVSVSASVSSNIIQLFQRVWQNSLVRKLLSMIFSLFFIIIIKKVIGHHKELEYFFTWMEQHPNKGMAAYFMIYPFHMLFFLPGTPLVMGAGYIFKIRFGWLWGVTLCSLITLLGSLIGSVMCFLLGRYCFRSSVRRWSKKYPLFDPIDAAVSDNSFKIMSLLYLTPVIPLGPLSYVMGTTSMPLVSFAKAKIAALPFTVLYVYLGAATGTLVAASDNLDPNSNAEKSPSVSISSKGMNEFKVDPKLIVFGILCSIGSIALISVKMKQELRKILDQQCDEEVSQLIHDDHKGNIASASNTNTAGQTRQRHKAPRINSNVDDVELQQSLVE